MAELTPNQKLLAPCFCGSGKRFVLCHGIDELCPCGSGLKAIRCCYFDKKTRDALRAGKGLPPEGEKAA